MFSGLYFAVFRWVALILGNTLPQNNPGEGPLILTPYVESGDIEKARSASAVDPSQFAGVNSHAAYFTVNKTNKWHLFFWYFPAEGLPLDSTPLVIWLQGGPGVSSLYGLFEEIGPIHIKDGSVQRRNITWSSNYSLLFIDNPVGTGFSFTEEPDKYVTNEDQVGECLLSFLQQFLQVFPELRKAPLFITGESYAGKYIPAFGHYIHHNQNDSMPINLKGLSIGDGWIDPPTMTYYSDFVLQLGLVDYEQAKEIQVHEQEARKFWDEHNMEAFGQSYAATKNLLNKYKINLMNYLSNSDNDHIDLGNYTPFLNREDIQVALHVKKMNYTGLNMIVNEYMMKSDYYDTVKPWLEELLEHYGVMCYNGQLDVVDAYAVTVNTYRSLQWSGRDAYLNAERGPLHDTDGRIIAFVKASGNFWELMIRNAGHTVPIDQPRAAKQIIDMFIDKFK